MIRYLYGVIFINVCLGMVDIDFNCGKTLGGLDMGVPFEILDNRGVWHKTRLVNRYGNILLMNIGIPVETVIGAKVRIAVN